VVVAVHVGYVDTDATKGLDVPKVSAAEVAEKTMDAIVRIDRRDRLLSPDTLASRAARVAEPGVGPDAAPGGRDDRRCIDDIADSRGGGHGGVPALGSAFNGQRGEPALPTARVRLERVS
jgi:hypothetical protein